MDGELLVYSRATDIKPKEVIQLKSCYFSVLDGAVSANEEQLLLVCFTSTATAH